MIWPPLKLVGQRVKFLFVSVLFFAFIAILGFIKCPDFEKRREILYSFFYLTYFLSEIYDCMIFLSTYINV